MKVTTEIKKRKIPIVRVDKALNKFDDKILFPDKLEKANEMLKKLDYLNSGQLHKHYC
ncbi:hypothetical protein K6T43_00015 (plasmid) [Riemerella anatipestifer]|uniref:hypothetical protein n=1 Tax=Riemerella anatipestifer TaxID=34085 RepID=UPI001E765BDA|nr:hypothetical protein [Riemerella anatipestifer]QZO94494.1 hypothetical protein K6T43_00015 [Riemerella anatipestifer]